MSGAGVYVAASSADLERARYWSAKLDRAGVVVTSNWIAAIDAAGASNPRGDDGRRVLLSRADLEQVDLAAVLWFLVPDRARADHDTRGAWWEAGHANSKKKVVVCSGPNTDQSIFCALGAEYVSDHDAFAAICAMARGEQR